MPDSENKKTQKWALLVGVNHYPKWKEYQLRGCINDVNAIEKLLISKQFGFPAENVLKLTSPSGNGADLANRENILNAFQQHLIENGRIKPGDVVVIYYSGHGSRIPDEDNDEQNKYDETLVPCDSGPDHEADIIDDEIAERLDQLAKRTKNINLFFDSCFSGTVTRAMLDAQEADAQGRARWLPPPKKRPDHARRRSSSRRGGTRSMGPSGWLPLSDGYVAISACRAVERARERPFFPFKIHSILTHCLLQAMRDVDEETTYYDIWETVRRHVNKLNNGQNPQIEGAFERRVFGGAALPRKRYVEVLEKRDNGAILAAGLVHGATAGSRFALFPQGTQVFDGSLEPIALVRLAEVDAFSASAELESGKLRKVAAGTPAIEIEHNYGAMQMSVLVVGDSTAIQAVRKQVAKSALLSLQDDDELPATAAVRLRYPIKFDGSEDRSKGQMLCIQSSISGQDLVEPVSPDDAGPKAVRQKLEAIARYHNLLAIHNTDPDSKLAGKVQLRIFELTEQNGQKHRVPVERSAGGEFILKGGKKYAIDAVNLHSKSVHVALFYCDSSWGVELGFPIPGAEDDGVAADSSRTLSHAEPEYEQVDKRLPLPRETLRLFATTDRVNFRSFWNKGTRGLKKDGSFGSLVGLASGGGAEPATRTRGKKQDGDTDDWTTDDLAFCITE